MLKHVSHAAFARRVVHSSGINEGVKGDYRSLMPFIYDPMHSVRKRKFGYVLLKLLQVLAVQQKRNRRQQKQRWFFGEHRGESLSCLKVLKSSLAAHGGAALITLHEMPAVRSVVPAIT